MHRRHHRSSSLTISNLHSRHPRKRSRTLRNSPINSLKDRPLDTMRRPLLRAG